MRVLTRLLQIHAQTPTGTRDVDHLLLAARGARGKEGGGARGGTTAAGIGADTAADDDVDDIQGPTAAMDVQIRDVTDDYAVVAIMGPQSRDLLRRVWMRVGAAAADADAAADDDCILRDEAFPPNTMQLGSLRVAGGGDAVKGAPTHSAPLD